MDESVSDHLARPAPSRRCRRIQFFVRTLGVVLAVAALGSRRPVIAQCGNGIVDADEDCDDGGTCIGGTNAGTHCSAESDCVGTGMCVGGSRSGTACASDAACPGGACRHCVPQGGDDCAANCTTERDVPFPMVPGQLDGLNLFPGTTGVVIYSDFLSIPLSLNGSCSGDRYRCYEDAECFGSTCVPPQETLTIGKPRAGKIPLVVKADSVRFLGIPVGEACGCIRGAAAKTCGGVAFEGDGVTPALDCTPGYTAGESLCASAGKPPCTFVHGAGNTASGEIGCDGLDNVDVSFSQDSGGTSGVARPPMVTLSGSGGPGSASVLNTIGITSILGGCAGSAPDYGPDGIYCTTDDPLGGIIATINTSRAVTGMATAVVHNANGADGVDLGPITATGAPFSCAALANGSAAGAGLVQAFAVVHLDTVGDVVESAQFFGGSPLPPPVCGNGNVEAGEDCDDGGTCIGGSNAGTHCTAESECIGSGVCVGGTHARSLCASDAACPGGACRHCVPQGGDGCAANCTTESDVPYPLVPGSSQACAGGANAGKRCSRDSDCPSSVCDYVTFAPGTSGVAITSDFLSFPQLFSAYCNGGENGSYRCSNDSDCPGATCVPSQQALTIGKERDGKIPLVVKVDSVKVSPIEGSTLSCSCVRGVAAKTCGGVAFDADGVTPATDCTPRFTAGDSLCTAPGKLPCAFVHGEGNTASGEVGCDGLDNINVDFTQDSGGANGVAGPPIVMFSGSGGPGSASVLNTLGVTTIFGHCGTDPTEYGPDGIFCTADDPPGGYIAATATSPAVTGTATALVRNANGADGVDLGPVTAVGAPFSCAALASGSAAGAGLVQAYPLVHLDNVGDVVITGQFFASELPTPTPTPVGSCIGDCDGSGDVTVDDLITLVNIDLGNAPLSACPSGDADVSGMITVDEIVHAVNVALNGCPTPAPTPTASPTATPPGLGAPCQSGAICASGSCTDHVCCSTDGCVAPARCDIFGAAGQCSPPHNIDAPCSQDTDCAAPLECLFNVRGGSFVCSLPVTPTLALTN